MLVVALVAALAAAAPARGADPVPPGYGVVAHENLSRGVEHWRVRRSGPDADVHIARIQPDQAARLRVVLAGDQVAGTNRRLETPSSMCARLHCIAAVNGDYFDIAARETVGGVVLRDELVRTPSIRNVQLFLDGQGRPSASHDLPWFGSYVAGDGQVFGVDGVNVPRQPSSLILYTPRDGPVTRPSPDAVELVLELSAGPPSDRTPGGVPARVTGLVSGGGTALSPTQYVLSGTGEDGAALQALWDNIISGFSNADGILTVTTGGVTESIGGTPWLLRGGARAFPDNPDSYTRGRFARTIAGWTPAGELLLVTVDGGSPGHSAGWTLAEASDFMASIGALDAINLDGGGSTSFAAGSRVLSRPSDRGGERPVASALVVLLPDDVTVGVASARGTEEACPTGRVPEDGMLDLPDGAAHEAAVDCMAWWSVARGAGDATYRPGDPVTRAQMASFLDRLLRASGSAPPVTRVDAFPDDTASIHAGAIDRLAAAGIVSGVGDGTYRTEAPVTRGQMATFLTRAVAFREGTPPSTSSDFFTDDVGTAHESSVNAAAAIGLTGGTNDGRYRPEDVVTRSQMASFLSRALSALVQSRPVPLP